MERMLAGLSTRRYGVGLEPVGSSVEQAATATSRSAVSRKFVAATETALAELMAADLSELDLVALGLGIDGSKHPLAIEEGSTENATLVRDLLVGLRERGLDVTRSDAPPACARAWARRSPCSASACHRPWPARCARPTP